MAGRANISGVIAIEVILDRCSPAEIQVAYAIHTLGYKGRIWIEDTWRSSFVDRLQKLEGEKGDTSRSG